MVLIKRVKVVGDHNEVKVFKPTKLKEPLPPFEPLQYLCLAELLIVDGYELADQFEGVEHLVSRCRVDNFGPLYLGHVVP